jgi:hypothetical protein
METVRIINFKNFKLTIRPAAKPDSIIVTFDSGTEMDSRGWESAAGDRKKIEEDFKFMFNPYDAPSLKKGEYMLHFNLLEKKQKFLRWLDGQKKQYFGIEDDK